MITVKIGNIFESNMKTLVNTVNCVGVMGKGIAKDFKEKYPKMFDEYRNACLKHQITPGTLYPYKVDGEIKLINFPTKNHWRSPSELEYIVTGLEWFIDNYKKLGVKSIAFPPLGCGNGGLSWDAVGPIMYKHLKNIDIPVEIYAPFGTKKEKISADFLSKTNEYISDQRYMSNKLNEKWFIPLQIVKYLNMGEYNVSVGRILFQKICYILDRYGVDLGASFTKGTYGPYSKDIAEMISILSNNNLIHEVEKGKMICLMTTDNFKFNKELYSKSEIDYMNKTYTLFRGIRNTAQAEILTTILFSYDTLIKNTNEVTENMLYDYIGKWKVHNKNFQDEFYIRDYIKHLAINKMINIDYTKDFKEYDVF